MARRSPFAPWRLFCKAMGCFAAGDEHGLRPTVDLLPEDFALRGTVAELRRSTGVRTGTCSLPLIRRNAKLPAKVRQELDECC
ncbi:MAG: hypothetical protein OXC31_04470 [Spirochaetaceae bacterium]|nr:hypothetical protein [Spirochaetaceae bacterium]